MVIMRAIVMLLAPGVGALFLFLGWFGYEFIFRKDVDLSDVVFSKERERELVRSNEDMERNMVSLEEAIEVSDNGELRKLVMGVAQGDYEKSLSAIALALNCEDTETAHYAASVLQDALNDFRLRVSREYNEVMERKDETGETAESLIKYMNKFLVQKVFSNVEQKSFAEMYADVCKVYSEECPEKFDSDIYESVCLRLLEVEDYERCAKWCEASMADFPDALSSYTCRLKLYFNTNQKEKFFETLEELKSSPIIIDNETLKLIRAFS